MTFKPAIWYPIAVLLSVVNLAAVGFTAGPAQPVHATAHAALALAFGVWALRLRQGPRDGPRENELPARLEAIEVEVSELRRELGETQERLDFAERLLAQGAEARRVGQQP
jgi:hypothetical protein